MIAIRLATPDDMPALTRVWRRAVAATHAFLTPDDIDGLEPEVEAGLPLLSVHVATLDEAAIAFMGMSENTIEALFIDPDHHRTGLGTRFVNLAKSLTAKGAVLRVDVNEQNPDALKFYLAQGFSRIGRSATDSVGRPWPILHLALVMP